MVNGFGAAANMANNTEIKRNCSSWRLEISPDRIHFLKFILEGYDGLAILSTIDPRQGIVEIKYPPEIKKDLTDLLKNIAPQLLKHTN